MPEIIVNEEVEVGPGTEMVIPPIVVVEGDDRTD